MIYFIRLIIFNNKYMSEDKIEIVHKDFIHGDTAVVGEAFVRDTDEVKKLIDAGELQALGRISYLMDALTEPGSDLSEDQIQARKTQLKELIEYAFEKNIIPEDEQEEYKGYIQELST